MNYLDLKNINYINKENHILKNISFSLNKGDYLSIIGKSGSGKSTLLKIISDLLAYTSGDIFYNSQNYKEYNPIQLRKSIVYCFQIPYLFPTSVLDNFKYPFEIRRKIYDENRIYKLLEQFNLSKDYLDKDVVNLSGGEAQRIALIRSLIFKPDILLLDEVTSSLDEVNTVLVENIIKELNKNGTTILSVTHDLEQSRKDANKLLTIEDGRILDLEVIK